MGKVQLFFSYARDNSDFVLKLAKDLREAGSNLWLDQLDIKPGDRWDQSIHEALKDCETLLVILSPASVNSENVMDEVAFALEEEKQVVPVLYMDCSIPFRLRRLQYVDFTGEYGTGFTHLVNALKVEHAVEQEKGTEIHNRTQQGSQKPVVTPLIESAQPASRQSATQWYSRLLKPVGILAVFALIGSLGVTAWQFGFIGRSAEAKLIAIGTGPYHIGDEIFSGWPELYGNCFEADFTSELPVKKLELKLETYGAENTSIHLNGHLAASLPPQPRQGARRPNYWSEERSVGLRTDLLKSGSNKLSICAEPVENPDIYGDKDDLQIRNLIMVAE